MGLAAFNRMRRIRGEAEKVEALEKSKSNVVNQPVQQSVSDKSSEVAETNIPTSKETKNIKVEGAKKPSTSNVDKKRS